MPFALIIAFAIVYGAGIKVGRLQVIERLANQDVVAL